MELYRVRQAVESKLIVLALLLGTIDDMSVASASCWTTDTIDRERNADCDYIQYATELLGFPTMMKYCLFYERPTYIISAI